ncbi:hypothetical protein VIGAN_10132300, partial [Vigna angularis var. angularis]
LDEIFTAYIFWLLNGSGYFIYFFCLEKCSALNLRRVVSRLGWRESTGADSFSWRNEVVLSRVQSFGWWKKHTCA